MPLNDGHVGHVGHVQEQYLYAWSLNEDVEAVLRVLAESGWIVYQEELAS